jgi:hypothetical protein
LLQIADQKQHVNTFDQTSYFNKLNDVVAAICNKIKLTLFLRKTAMATRWTASGSSAHGFHGKAPKRWQLNDSKHFVGDPS